MSFPFTLNGNVYTAADFTVEAVARTLGEFLSDLQVEAISRRTIIVASGASFDLPVSSSNVLVVPAGKDFGVGKLVVITTPDYPLVTVWGTVTAYAGTSMTIRVDQETANAPAGPLDRIAIAPGARAITDPGNMDPSIVTNANDLTDNRDDFGLGLTPAGRQEVYDDFGKHRPAELATDGIGWNDRHDNLAGPHHGVPAAVSGNGRAEYSGLWTLPNALRVANRAGFMRMQVSLPGDVVGLCLPNLAAQMITGSLTYKTSFFLPEVPGSADANKFWLTVGMMGGDSGSTTQGRVPYELLPHPESAGASLPLRGSMLRMDGEQGHALPELYSTSYLKGSATVAAFALRAGVFYNYMAGVSATDTIRHTLTSSDGQDSPVGVNPGVPSNIAMSPFISIGKLTGSKPRVVYVDYFYVSHA